MQKFFHLVKDRLAAYGTEEECLKSLAAERDGVVYSAVEHASFGITRAAKSDVGCPLGSTAGDGISRRIVQALHLCPMTAVELHRQIGGNRNSIQTMLTTLRRQGLVARAPWSTWELTDAAKKASGA